MSRPNSPWFRKSNKRWYVWFDGKQVNLGPEKKAAFLLFHQLMATPKQSGGVVHKEQRLIELADAFLEWVHRNRSPDTYEWYRYRLARLCEKYGDMNAAELKPYHVEEWVSQYQLKTTSRRNYFRSVKRCYNWAVQQGFLDRNPITALEVPRAEAKEVSLTATEFDRLLSFARNDDLRELMQVTWLTGCRPQESLIVEASHVDEEHQRWVFRTSQSKGKRITRVVYLCDEAMAIVGDRMKRYSTGPLFRNTAGKPWKKDSVNCAFDALQTRQGTVAMREQGIEVTNKEIEALKAKLEPTRCRNGKVIEKTDVELRAEAKRKLIQKIVKQLVPRYSLYALRHSFATNALRKGIDSLTVAVLLGHQDPSTLARVYQHLNQNPEHLLKEVKRAVA